MKVKVKLYGQFRYTTNSKEVEIEPKGDTVKEVLSSLIAAYPTLGPAILNEDQLRPYVNLLVNGKSIKETGGLATKIKEGDDVTLFPPMAGG